MSRRHGHLFSSKEVSILAVISDVLGAISVFSCGWMIWLTYRDGGRAQLRYGGVVFVCLFFSLLGMIMAILSRREPEKQYFFSYLGMVLNGVVLALGFVVMYLGLA